MSKAIRRRKAASFTTLRTKEKRIRALVRDCLSENVILFRPAKPIADNNIAALLDGKLDNWRAIATALNQYAALLVLPRTWAVDIPVYREEHCDIISLVTDKPTTFFDILQMADTSVQAIRLDRSVTGYGVAFYPGGRSLTDPEKLTNYFIAQQCSVLSEPSYTIQQTMNAIIKEQTDGLG